MPSSVNNLLNIYEVPALINPAENSPKSTSNRNQLNIPTQNPVHIVHFIIYDSNSMLKDSSLFLADSKILL